MNIEEAVTKTLELINQLEGRLPGFTEALTDRLPRPVAHPYPTHFDSIIENQSLASRAVKVSKWPDYNAIQSTPDGWVGGIKIPTIKLIRAATGLGLREAKQLSEASAPVTIWCANESSAEDFINALRVIGGWVESQPT